MLSTREIAGLIWIGILVLAALGYRPTRRSVPAILRSFAKLSILTAFGAYFAWIGGGVYLAHLAGIWNTSMLGPTILWSVFAGAPLMFSTTKAATDPRWLLQQLRALFSVTVFLEFMVNAQTFHLPIELALQGILGFLVLLASVASIRPEHQAVARLIDSLTGCICLILGAAGVVYVASRWQEVDWLQTTRDFSVPVWLGAWAAVFVAAIGLFTNLERIFRLMSQENRSWRGRFCRILPLALRAGLRPRVIRKCHGYWYNRLANASGIGEARQIVIEFLQHQADTDALEEAEAQQLIDNAGLRGTNEEGAQLDQREFKETWRALEKIMLWFHGWYGKNTPGYDLAKIQQIMSSHDFKEFPDDHGITTHVSPDGESCYAMRRTVTGRVLAVGLHGHKFREWHWDGDHEPSGYPGQCGDWGTDWAAQAFNPSR